MLEIRTEAELALIARALAPKQPLTAAERKLAPYNAPVDSRHVRAAQDLILAGEDPLGECLLALRSPEVRRGAGAVYTPKAIVNAMVCWAASKGNPKRIVDAGCGSGRFTVAAAKAFPKARLVACDIDPLAVLILRANAAVLRFADRLEAQVIEYRSLEIADIEGRTLYIGNPPYVRHHHISADAKSWFGKIGAKLGFTASKLAGLHVHFFLRTREVAKKGDWGAFITAAEWMDVNYGSVVRHMLSDGLGGSSLQVFKPEGMPFEDAMTTGVITTFMVGKRPAQLTVRELASFDDLIDLEAGSSVEWADVLRCDRWSELARPKREIRAGMIPLGDLFRVHRGAVTGGNKVFIEGAYPGSLPARFLVPSITKAKELFSSAGAITKREASLLRRVIDIPPDLTELTSDEAIAIENFKGWARCRNADQTYTAKSRRAWWSVRLKAPAPILCTYMARRAPTFVRNLAGVRHINIAHGLYPRVQMTSADLDAYAAFLRENVCQTEGRTYAGGLTKFEPKEVERILVPALSAVRSAYECVNDARGSELDAAAADMSA